MIVDKVEKYERQIRECNDIIAELLYKQALLHYKDPEVTDAWVKIGYEQASIRTLKRMIKDILN